MSALVCACSDKNNAAADNTYNISALTVEQKPFVIQTQLNGEVVASSRADIIPQVDGIIVAQYFKEGSYVNKGEPLYKLDDSLYQAQLDNAKASLDKAITATKKAQLDFDRYAKLYQSRSVSKQEYDTYNLALQSAKNDQALAQAMVKEAEVNLGYTNIISPISGNIGSSDYTVGMLVQKNQSQKITSIINLDTVYVDLYQSAKDWQRFRSQIISGKLSEDTNSYNVTLKLDNELSMNVQGHIALGDYEVEDNGSVRLRATFNNPHHLLLPGMKVSANVVAGVIDNAIVIPSSCIYQDPKGQSFVFKISKDNVVTKTPIQVGYLSYDGYHVLSGVKIGDVIASSGVSRLKTGLKINIIKSTQTDDK